MILEDEGGYLSAEIVAVRYRRRGLGSDSPENGSGRLDGELDEIVDGVLSVVNRYSETARGVSLSRLNTEMLGGSYRFAMRADGKCMDLYKMRALFYAVSMIQHEAFLGRIAMWGNIVKAGPCEAVRERPEVTTDGLPKIFIEKELYYSYEDLYHAYGREFYDRGYFTHGSNLVREDGEDGGYYVQYVSPDECSMSEVDMFQREIGFIRNECRGADAEDAADVMRWLDWLDGECKEIRGRRERYRGW